ncbi:MAG: FAD-dependent oxidoreductase [Lachnospiraceae bacterium]|nr:FAD-dependent oxidoreductase [Lachnospiraceae bacterium]
MGKYWLEPERNIEIFDECDILVVGGGSAGHSAAIAAARAGAKNIILLERYGYMGGDVTGGYVIMVPSLSYKDKSFVRGIQEEWFTRMANIPGAVLGPEGKEVGSEKPEDIYKWAPIFDAVSSCPDSPKRVVRSVYFEPNQLKIEMDKMLFEERDRIRVYCHTWATRPIMEGDLIKGVVFESKEGRKAILAKVVIDATGDGDIFSQAGAAYEEIMDKNTRCANTALVWRAGGCDFEKFFRSSMQNPESMMKVFKGLGETFGHRCIPLPTPRNDIVWFNNWIGPMLCTDIKDLTATEMDSRDKIRGVMDFLRENVAGFENAFLYDIAPQTGNRCSRRLKGEYYLTPFDFAFHNEFDDVIAWHSTVCKINDSAPIEIPYRTILPVGVENLLAPGRHLSADNVAIDWVSLIPQCIGTGQAAGIAAAVALEDGSTVHTVNIKKVQDILVAQDVPLPRRKDVDPELTEVCEANNWGLYTEMAKKAAADPEEFKKYRQW